MTLPDFLPRGFARLHGCQRLTTPLLLTWSSFRRRWPTPHGARGCLEGGMEGEGGGRAAH